MNYLGTNLPKKGSSGCPSLDRNGGRHQGLMVLIPAGTFRMGSVQGSSAEAPVHEVQLQDFWLDVTPVSNWAFAAFTRECGYRTEVERVGSAWGMHEGEFQEVPELC